jgi:hypothetical protein
MIRALYQCILQLHPPDFREQFAGEMLWIFDESAASEGVLRLFADGLVSLVRQWVIGYGAWKVPVAALGGFLHMATAMSLIRPVPPPYLSAAAISAAAASPDVMIGGLDSIVEEDNQ